MKFRSADAETPHVKRHIFAALLFVAGLIAFLNSFDVPFLFDDGESILANSSIREMGSFRWLHASPDGTAGGRPATNLLFAANYSFNGISPFGYHVVNFGIHALAALVIFFWLDELLKSSLLPARVAKYSTYLAFICAVLWECHPVTTYTVTYISQRSEGLMSLCYLTAIYSFWKWMGPSTNGRWPYIAVAICFVGMASKEGMATAPVMIWLVDRTFFAKSFLGALKIRRWFYAGLASSWALLLTLYFTAPGRGTGFSLGVPWWKYALTECHVIFMYLKLIWIPSPLVFDHGFVIYARNIDELPFLGLLAVVVAAVGVLLWKRPVLGLACAWFFILIAPSSSIIPIASQPMGENRIYLALLGPIVLSVIFIYLFLRSASWPLFAGWACCFIQLTLDRNYDFGSAVRIWDDTVRKVPNNPRALTNLGEALFREGRLTQADKEFDEAMRVFPSYEEAYHNKGEVALKRGDAAASEAWFKLAVERAPNRFASWRSLGATLAERGALDEADACFHRALALRADDTLSIVGLGNVMLKRGKVAEAISLYQTAVETNPDLAISHNDLGFALLTAGDAPHATEQFLIAVSLDPDLPRPQSNLATMYARAGDYKNAVWHYLYALRLSDKDSETWVNLGMAYQLSGQRSLAENCFQTALKKNPNDPRAELFLTKLKSSPAK